MNELQSIDNKIKKVEEEKASIPIDELLRNIDLLPKLSEDQVEKLLTTLPYKMEEIENKLAKLEIIYDEAQTRAKRIEAEFKLKSIELKARKELLSEGDRSSWVLCQQAVQDAQDDVIKAKAILKETQVIFNRYERNFVAVRKIASLINEVNVNMGISQKVL
ncbi:MAG: hypothetical protein IJ122_06390 [Methanobrevibacter sp.]|nr:hypothetical protein [Methanobrevibacter sp.]